MAIGKSTTNVSRTAARLLSAEQIANINGVARGVYMAHPGQQIDEGYDFSNACDLLSKRCWNSAVIVFDNEGGGIADVDSLLFCGVPT